MDAGSRRPLRKHILLRNPPSRQNSDRFIPNRSSIDFDMAHYLLTKGRRKEKEQPIGIGRGRRGPVHKVLEHADRGVPELRWIRGRRCARCFGTRRRELLSSHGFTQNQLTLWKYPSMVKVAELTGHTSRVLFMAQSPDGCTVASAAGDETLKFWNVFGTLEPSKPVSKV